MREHPSGCLRQPDGPPVARGTYELDGGAVVQRGAHINGRGWGCFEEGEADDGAGQQGDGVEEQAQRVIFGVVFDGVVVVVFFSLPITSGPINPPPKFPRELITAMPAAAAVPRRNAGGMAQNGPSEPKAPAAASDSPMIAISGVDDCDAISMPMELVRQLSITCSGRSPRWSELRPIRTIPMTALMNGIAESKPMRTSSFDCVTSLMIVGVQ